MVECAVPPSPSYSAEHRLLWTRVSQDEGGGGLFLADLTRGQVVLPCWLGHLGSEDPIPEPFSRRTRGVAPCRDATAPGDL